MIEGIPTVNFSLLVIGTFLVSFFVSAIGPTGGLQLFTVAAALPPQLAIPVHAWITGASALFRTWNLRSYIDWHFFRWFAVPSLAASVSAAFFAFQLEPRYLQVCIGLYITGYTLLQAFNLPIRSRSRTPHPTLAGVVTGFVTIFIGASGPLLFVMMMPHYHNKEELMGTHSACLTVQHASKIILFGALGVTILGYPIMMAATAAASWIGTWIGNFYLLKIPDKLYRILLQIVMVFGGLFIVLKAL